MAMPRFARGGVVGADPLNQAMQEIDLQGLTCKVRTTYPSGLAPNTDYIVPWAAKDTDTFGGGMWDPAAPAYVFIRADGLYLAKAQLRLPPFANGEAAGKILLNSTNVASSDPVAGPKTEDKRPWSNAGSGVTLNMLAVEPMYAGDRVYTGIWHSCSSNISGLLQNFGGSYLSVSRIAGLS